MLDYNTDNYSQSSFTGFDDDDSDRGVLLLSWLRSVDFFGRDYVAGSDKAHGDHKAGNEIERARKAAKKYVEESKDKAFAFWQVFEAVYAAKLEKDAWSEAIHYAGKKTNLARLVADLEIVIGMSKPRASEGFYKGQLNRLVDGRAFMPVQRYLDNVYANYSEAWVHPGTNPKTLKVSPDDMAKDRKGNPLRIDLTNPDNLEKLCSSGFTLVHDFKPFPQWDELASILFGTEDELSQAMLTLFLINCCRRAFNPGCIQKRVLVLKSSQDDGKSAFCSTLALGWGTELSHEKSEADIIRLMRATWIMELAECDKHFKGRESSTWKNLISTRVDKYIEKYETEVTEAPRVTCFIGTTNQDRFLTDPTGNKRYWVVEIAEGHKLPIEWLQNNIDHIWATAYHIYKQQYPTDLSDNQKLESEARNREYMIEGSFVEQLERVLEGATKEGAKNIAFKVLDIQLALGTHNDNQAKNKAAVINSLKQLGYAEKPLWVNGKTERLYRLATETKPVKAKYIQGEGWVYWSDKLNDWQISHETAIEDRKKARGQA